MAENTKKGQTMKRTIKRFRDAGHRWLEVDRADLDTLRIASKVKSYGDGQRVYLEENEAGLTFLHCAKLAGWQVEIVDTTPTWADGKSTKGSDQSTRAKCLAGYLKAGIQ